MVSKEQRVLEIDLFFALLYQFSVEKTNFRFLQLLPVVFDLINWFLDIWFKKNTFQQRNNCFLQSSFLRQIVLFFSPFFNPRKDILTCILSSNQLKTLSIQIGLYFILFLQRRAHGKHSYSALKHDKYLLSFFKQLFT